MTLQLERRPQIVAQHRLNAALRQLLHNPAWERRSAPRLPYFGPVSISSPDGPELDVSAFARDLSAVGIGLVHLMPLDRGEVVITLPLHTGEDLVLHTEIVWCRDYGNGWYSSGGRFIDVV